MKKKIFTLSTSLLLSIVLFGSQAFAVSKVTFDTPTDFDSNFNTTVTMTLDGDIRQSVTTDIVFVADINYLKLNSSQALIDSMKSFASTLDNSGDVDANIALVLYGNASKMIFDLTSVHDIVDNTVEQKIEESLSWINSHGVGSNIQSGVLEGHKILDNSATGSQKINRHLVLITDGSATSYNNADGVSSTSVFKGSGMYLPLGNMDSNGDVGKASRETKMVKYFNETGGDYAAAFAKLYAEGSQIEQYAARGYEYPGKANYSSEQINRLRELDAAGQLTTYSVSDVNNIEKYPYTNTEIGAYMGAKALSDVAQDYTVHTIGYLYEWGFNDDNSFLLKLIALPSRGFVEWAKQLGDLYFEESKTISTEKMSELFNTIDDKLEELVSEVSVTSEIGSGVLEDGKPYEFEFVNDIEKIAVSLDGEELEKSIDENGNYVFKKDGETYFTLELTPKTSDKNATFKFNVVHSVTGTVKLKYTLALADENIPEDGEFVDMKNLKINNSTVYRSQSGEISVIETPSISYTNGTVPAAPNTGAKTASDKYSTESNLGSIIVAAAAVFIGVSYAIFKKCYSSR